MTPWPRVEFAWLCRARPVKVVPKRRTVPVNATLSSALSSTMGLKAMTKPSSRTSRTLKPFWDRGSASKEAVEKSASCTVPSTCSISIRPMDSTRTGVSISKRSKPRSCPGLERFRTAYIKSVLCPKMAVRGAISATSSAAKGGDSTSKARPPTPVAALKSSLKKSMENWK